MAKYRKKPVEVEAVQWTGNNWTATYEFAGCWPVCAVEDQLLLVNTLEGVVRAEPGDWIIKGVNGEFYPCKPDIFEKTYERVDEE